VTTAIFVPSYAETYCVLCMVSQDAHPPDGCRFPLCAGIESRYSMSWGILRVSDSSGSGPIHFKEVTLRPTLSPLALIERGGNVTNV